MDKEQLEQKRADLEKRFNELDEQKLVIEQEQHRLQGEYRLLNELLPTLDGVEKPKRIRKAKDEENATS